MIFALLLQSRNFPSSRFRRMHQEIIGMRQGASEMRLLHADSGYVTYKLTEHAGRTCHGNARVPTIHWAPLPLIRRHFWACNQCSLLLGGSGRLRKYAYRSYKPYNNPSYPHCSSTYSSFQFLFHYPYDGALTFQVTTTSAPAQRPARGGSRLLPSRWLCPRNRRTS